MTENVAWLTQEGYDRLRTELDHLMGPARTEIAKRIEAARAEGDLSENGGYHAAKEQQGHQEARIRQLQALLLRAKVGEAPPDDGVVEPGMTVEIRFAGDDETETFLLGSREISSTTDLTVYSPESALGKAILGARSGQTVNYVAPSGADIKVTVVSFEPFEG